VKINASVQLGETVINETIELSDEDSWTPEEIAAEVEDWAREQLTIAHSIVPALVLVKGNYEA
jgi:hypothetical protein